MECDLYHKAAILSLVSEFVCFFPNPPDDGRTKPVPRKGHSESFDPADNKCLVRASDGKKKISTVVSLLMCDYFMFMFLHKVSKPNMLSFQVSTKEVIKFQMVCSDLYFLSLFTVLLSTTSHFIFHLHVIL